MNEQPNTDEMARRRIATVLTKAGRLDDTKSVNEWFAMFNMAHFRPECMAEGVQKLLEKCFDQHIPVRYAKDAEEVFFSMLPRRMSSDKSAAIEQMEANIREEQRVLREKVMSDPEMRKEYMSLRKKMVQKEDVEDTTPIVQDSV